MYFEKQNKDHCAFLDEKILTHLAIHPRRGVMNKFHFMPQLVFTEQRKHCSITEDKFELIWVILNKFNWN